MPGLTRHPAAARLRGVRVFAIKDLIALDPGSSPGWRSMKWGLRRNATSCRQRSKTKKTEPFGSVSSSLFSSFVQSPATAIQAV